MEHAPTDRVSAPWLLLIHQLPPKPAYFRVKIWRRLQGLGAIAIKSSVYALPLNEQTREDFEWLLREIAEGGGEGSVCEARFVDGLSDPEIQALFDRARDADYEEIAKEARALGASMSGPPERWRKTPGEIEGRLVRLRKRFADVCAIDFFGANGREPPEGLLSELESRIAGARQPERVEETAEMGPAEELKGKVWVTRRGVHVDRIACAWLIRRFIDPDASFRFVDPKGHAPQKDELRFDMFEAEFTHEGDRCSFEVLLARAGIGDPALRPIAEIVHDIDLKDGKFRREEAAGIARLIAGIGMATRDDEERIARGAALFDDLYEYFRRKRG